MTSRSLQILHAMGVAVYRKPVLRQHLQKAATQQHSVTAEVGLKTKGLSAPPLHTNVEPIRAQPKAPVRVVGPAATPRTRSITAEFVVPQADLARFEGSKLRTHLALVLNVSAASVSANTDARDTALLLDVPEKSVLKIGSLARLRSQWRAKREAWLAIRMWRKQWR
jgi:hypothetical protein